MRAHTAPLWIFHIGNNFYEQQQQNIQINWNNWMTFELFRYTKKNVNEGKLPVTGTCAPLPDDFCIWHFELSIIIETVQHIHKREKYMVFEYVSGGGGANWINCGYNEIMMENFSIAFLLHCYFIYI